MASMIRKIQRGMLRRAATRGVYGSRNKAALFAVTWANYRAGKEHASQKRRAGMIERALMRLGLRMKERTAVED